MCEFSIYRTSDDWGWDMFLNGVISIPFLFVIVMLLMTFVVGRVADKFVQKYTAPTDSFYPKIVFNLIACVLMMSMSMTIIGPFVGNLLSGNLTLDPIIDWPQNWPVNFCIAFWVEMLIAQPAARAVMKRKHIRMLKRKAAEA